MHVCCRRPFEDARLGEEEGGCGCVCVCVRAHHRCVPCCHFIQIFSVAAAFTASARLCGADGLFGRAPAAHCAPFLAFKGGLSGRRGRGGGRTADNLRGLSGLLNCLDWSPKSWGKEWLVPALKIELFILYFPTGLSSGIFDVVGQSCKVARGVSHQCVSKCWSGLIQSSKINSVKARSFLPLRGGIGLIEFKQRLI